MTLAEKTLEIAIKNIGVEEHPRGSNSGPEVNIYLRSIGLGPGYAWCMAFVYWCVKTAAAELEVKNPLVKTGGVAKQWQQCTLRKFPGKATASVQPGDIMIMIFKGGLGHTGFVEKVSGGIIHTIEANTNISGEREGYKVCRKQRPISAIHGYIQLN